MGKIGTKRLLREHLADIADANKRFDAEFDAAEQARATRRSLPATSEKE